MSDGEVVIGPAKEVLDEKAKEEPQREQAPRPGLAPARAGQRSRFLHSLNVSQLISLYNDDAACGTWNEEARCEILEIILEKGGPGAVRRALGRELATGDDRTEPDGSSPGSPAGSEEAPLRHGPASPEEATTPLEQELAGLLGRAFLRAALRRVWNEARDATSGPGPDDADRALLKDGRGFSLDELKRGVLARLAAAVLGAAKVAP